jgi:hypothetical protein
MPLKAIIRRGGAGRARGGAPRGARGVARGPTLTRAGLPDSRRLWRLAENASPLRRRPVGHDALLVHHEDTEQRARAEQGALEAEAPPSGVENGVIGPRRGPHMAQAGPAEGPPRPLRHNPGGGAQASGEGGLKRGDSGNAAVAPAGAGGGASGSCARAPPAALRSTPGRGSWGAERAGRAPCRAAAHPARPYAAGKSRSTRARRQPRPQPQPQPPRGGSTHSGDGRPAGDSTQAAASEAGGPTPQPGRVKAGRLPEEQIGRVRGGSRQCCAVPAQCGG